MCVVGPHTFDIYCFLVIGKLLIWLGWREIVKLIPVAGAPLESFIQKKLRVIQLLSDSLRKRMSSQMSQIEEDEENPSRHDSVSCNIVIMHQVSP